MIVANERPLVPPLPAPELNIPESSATVDVRVIDR